MRKLLTRYALIPLALTVLVLGGCGGEERPDEYQTSMLEDLPFVYKMTVQQGNIINEEMVDGLQLGMTKNQVRYLLGTSLLTDFFHSDRWDYVYTIRRGHEDMQSKKLTLYFQDDALTRIDGTMRPDPARAARREPTEILVDVPDYKERKGLIRRSLEVIGAEPKD